MNSETDVSGDAFKARFCRPSLHMAFLIFSVCSVASMDLRFVPKRWHSHTASASMGNVVASMGTRTVGN